MLELKFNDNGNWEVMCSGNFCKPGINYDIYLNISFNGSEISYVSLGCSEYYIKTGRNEIRDESDKLFNKSFYMHKVFELENFYQTSCNNKILGYYVKNNNGEYSRIEDLTKVTVSFSDGDCQNSQDKTI